MSALSDFLGHHRLKTSIHDGCFCTCDAWSVGRGPQAGPAHDQHLAEMLSAWLEALSSNPRVRDNVADAIVAAEGISRRHAAADYAMDCFLLAVSE